MRLVIFDVDGTLVDSQIHIIEAQARAFARFGRPAPTRKQALSVVGLSLTEAFTALAGPDAPIAALAEAYKAAWTELRQRPGYTETLYPGAADLVADLAGRPDILLGIATGKSRRGVDRLLAAHGWRDIFATVQTADEHPSKPHPSMLETACAETGVAPAASLMVGDTTFDVEMAVASGVTPIGVAWGYHDVAALHAAGARTVAGSFGELRGVLDAPAREAA